MLREITIGQYYPVDSVLHRMDPRTKLFGTMVYIVSLFLADNGKYSFPVVIRRYNFKALLRSLFERCF